MNYRAQGARCQGQGVDYISSLNSHLDPCALHLEPTLAGAPKSGTLYQVSIWRKRPLVPLKALLALNQPNRRVFLGRP